MLKKLKALLNWDTSESESEDTSHDELLRVAAAVLMVEAAHLDGNFDEAEKATIHMVLKRHFSLSQEEADELVGVAIAEQEEADHLHRFTSAIKNGFSESERAELIELLWEVVYADGELHAYESNLLRRVGGLIYGSDRERGEARKRGPVRLSQEN